MNIVHINQLKVGEKEKIALILFVYIHEHHLASRIKFGQVDFRSHLPEWQVDILTKVTPCNIPIIFIQTASFFSLSGTHYCLVAKGKAFPKATTHD
jgi:hypothetical protein